MAKLNVGIIRSFLDAACILNGKQAKQIGFNTQMIRVNSTTIGVIVHETQILTFTPAGFVIDSGGWRTPLTLQRINALVPVTLCTRKREWYYADGTKYQDRMFHDWETCTPVPLPEDLPLPPIDACGTAAAADYQRFAVLRSAYNSAWRANDRARMEATRQEILPVVKRLVAYYRDETHTNRMHDWEHTLYYYTDVVKRIA